MTTQIVDSYTENKISYSEIESCSDDHLLQLFHGKSDNSFGNWFGLKHAWQDPLPGDRREHAWLLGEGVVLLQIETASSQLSASSRSMNTENLLIAQTSAPWRGPEEHAQIKSHGLTGSERCCIVEINAH